VLGQYRAGTLPRVDRRETVRSYLERWYVTELDAGQMPASTAAAYRGHLDRYLLPHLGPLRLHELQGRHIEGMFRRSGRATGWPGRSGRRLSGASSPP